MVMMSICVTNDPNQPSICEDVYYYDNDIPDAFQEQIRYGDRTFLYMTIVFMKTVTIEDKRC